MHFTTIIATVCLALLLPAFAVPLKRSSLAVSEQPTNVTAILFPDAFSATIELASWFTDSPKSTFKLLYNNGNPMNPELAQP